LRCLKVNPNRLNLRLEGVYHGPLTAASKRNSQTNINERVSEQIKGSTSLDKVISQNKTIKRTQQREGTTHTVSCFETCRLCSKC
jgi:hypothetical protein